MTKSTQAPSVTIKFDHLAEQTVEDIKRISGFVRARHIISVIDVLDLDANPRSSKVGRVTDAIISSIETTPDEFPFKSKGILLGATEYEMLDRGRVRAVFHDRAIEGILDGGHNTLAIGLHILRLAGVTDSDRKKAKDWFSFRELWDESSGAVKEYRAQLSAFGKAEPADDDDLAFYIPVELIVPADQDSQANVDKFQSSLLEICEARNNNAELVVGAKSNKAGYYDDLKKYLPTDIADRIEWKPGEPGGKVKAQDVIALTWLPLSRLDPIPSDVGEKPISPPIPQNLYRNKGECMQKFHDLMNLDAVTHDRAGAAELYHGGVRSALAIAADIPALWDLISELFPAAYNNNGDGRYGRITEVKAMNPENKKRFSKFAGRPITTASPDGYIYPLVWGLTALMRRDEETGRVEWATDPEDFIRANLTEIAQKFRLIMQVIDYDPVKIGKAPAAYQVVHDAFTAILARSKQLAAL